MKGHKTIVKEHIKAFLRKEKCKELSGDAFLKFRMLHPHLSGESLRDYMKIKKYKSGRIKNQ